MNNISIVKSVIDRNRFRKEIRGWVDKYGYIHTTITKLNIALERSEIKGKWIESHEVFDYITCSECLKTWCVEDNDTETFKYCPRCGAKMDKELEQEK